MHVYVSGALLKIYIKKIPQAAMFMSAWCHVSYIHSSHNICKIFLLIVTLKGTQIMNTFFFFFADTSFPLKEIST